MSNTTATAQCLRVDGVNLLQVLHVRACNSLHTTTNNKKKILVVPVILDVCVCVYLLAVDIASEKLKTGDVVLFSRDCGLYYPCGAVHCEMTKATTGQPFDHAGIVVLRYGFPYLAEWTPSGIKVRGWPGSTNSQKVN